MDTENDLPLDGPDDGKVFTLPDGSVSVPVFEEVLVVQKHRRVRERIIVRKETVIEEYVVEADLRRQEVELEVDDEVAHRVR